MKKLALLMAILMMVCASASAVTASDENVYPIADEVVTLTVWTGNVANRDYVNCDMTKFIEEKLGVKINFQFYTDDANTAYNLMLASDEWPDIFLGPWFSTDKILMGMEAKMLLPLNDLIETQGYNYKAVLEANPGYKDMLTAPDGNIYTFVGLKNVTTGDTLCDEKSPISLESMTFPDPVIEVAVEPKTKADQEKMSIALAKLSDEDPTFQVKTDEESGQTLISGMGELQLDIIVDRMRREFKVECNVGNPQVAYRETIRKAVMNQEYTHKKQTGGSGQFAKVLMNFEPLDTENGETYEFVNEVTGGHITKEFIPSIDAGVQEAMESGILAGFPVVGVKATVTDGQVHDVDSSEMAFKIAGSMCFKEAAPKAKPVILEPIMAVEVRTPEEYMGDVMGDINARRGSIQSMTDSTGVKVIDAKVPLSEMFGYIGDLRSKTQGRAMFTMQMDSYAEVPKNVSEEIIKAQRGE